MNGDLFYFAYGSNMSVPRIQARIPAAEFVSVASLMAHRLTFSKPGTDASGKCDALFTGCVDDVVYGVVYRITAEDKQVLDGYEGLGVHYQVKTGVVSAACADLEVFFYVATEVRDNLRPYHWYKKHVLYGAQEAGIPEAYCNSIATVVAIDDPDLERHRREMRIY